MSNASAKDNTKNIEKKFQDAHQQLEKAKQEIGKVIFGQENVMDQTLITLMSGGHLLLIGVPGLAKTLLVETMAGVLGLSSNRIQCTPDLMPADVMGSEVLEENEKGKRSFRFIEGPVFTQFLMIDEINRASPRTQSAFLQAMQEKQLTISGKTHDLPTPFHVLATQNPIEQEGTYPLPEAQLDRFMMQIDVDYPGRDAERQMLLATTTGAQTKIKAILKDKDLLNIQKLIREMPIGEKVIEAILNLVRNGRPEESAVENIRKYVAWAPGPRASQALMLATRAKALLDGRETPSTDDVAELAIPVLKHRMALNYNARSDGIGVSDIIRKLAGDL